MDPIISILDGCKINDIIEVNGELSIHFQSPIGQTGKIIIECPVKIVRDSTGIIDVITLDELDDVDVITRMKSIIGERVNTLWVDYERLILYIDKSEVTLYVRSQEDDEFSVSLDNIEGITKSFEFRSDTCIESLVYKTDS